MPAKAMLTQKDLSLITDLLSYEQWAAKKSQMYGQTLTDPQLQGLCKTLSDNHTRNFNELINFLNAF